jgi:hypothetical protein
MAAKKPVKRKYVRKNKKGKGHRKITMRKPLDSDALFTMVLSCQTFLSKRLKDSGVKINDKVLLNKVSSALLDTMYAQEEKATYNLAADALAAAYIAQSKGDKSNSRKLAQLAFQSPDCEKLMAGLMAINEDAVMAKDEDPCWDGYEMMGMKDKNGKSVPNCIPMKKNKKSKADFNDAAGDTDSSDTDSSGSDNEDQDMADSADENDAKDTTGGQDDEDEGTEGVNPSDVNNSDADNMATASRKFKKELRRKIKAAQDDYQIDYGIDGTEGGNDSELDNSDDDDDDEDDDSELLEVETLGGLNSKIPDTMRLERPTDINEIVGDYPDNLPKIEPLTASQLRKIASKNPDVISIANKIAILGDEKGKKLALKFLRNAS